MRISDKMVNGRLKKLMSGLKNMYNSQHMRNTRKELTSIPYKMLLIEATR